MCIPMCIREENMATQKTKKMEIGNLKVEGKKVVGKDGTEYDTLSIRCNGFHINLFDNLMSVHPRDTMEITVFDSEDIKITSKKTKNEAKIDEPKYMNFNMYNIVSKKVKKDVL